MEEEKERVMHDVSAGECVSLQNCQLGEIKLKLVPKQHAAEITARWLVCSQFFISGICRPLNTLLLPSSGVAQCH